eukprot:5383-Prorocentrum_minimum.AAC.2
MESVSHLGGRSRAGGVTCSWCGTTLVNGERAGRRKAGGSAFPNDRHAFVMEVCCRGRLNIYSTQAREYRCKTRDGTHAQRKWFERAWA